MNRLLSLERWGDAHHPKWLDILRICFGLFLSFKGIQLLNNINSLEQVMSNKLSLGSYGLVVLSHYIVFAHVVGGLFIAMGLLTRIACMVQIPILLGAIIFINSSGTLFNPVWELIMSILTLVLLCVFLVVGSGPWSVNRFVERENQLHPN